MVLHNRQNFWRTYKRREKICAVQTLFLDGRLISVDTLHLIRAQLTQTQQR
jgi:hypothetical protein